jgi:hypothetical protein
MPPRLADRLRNVMLAPPQGMAGQSYETYQQDCAVISEAAAALDRTEALEQALTAIIYASDQCQGHRGCGHSMEPWQNARKLLGLAALSGGDPQ